MKKYLPFIFCFIAACSTSKNSGTISEDKTLLIAVKKLDKDPANEMFKNNVISLYNSATKIHLDKIEVYSTLTEATKWDKIIKEYTVLNNLSFSISNSRAASTIVKAPTYNNEILIAKQSGAQNYYELGLADLKEGDKQSARSAYYSFKKANEFVPGYKDLRQQIAIAYQNSIIKVVINPVRDYSYYSNRAGWNTFGNNFNYDFFQRNLVRDLGGSYNKKANALFYTDREASRENVNPDWEIDLTWVDLYIPEPASSRYTRNVSRQIQSGSDTAGKPIYQTVYATLDIVRKYFNATGDMEVRIMDIHERRTITTNRYTSRFNWQEEYATYSGDSRALGNNEYAMLNNNSYRIPRKEDILDRIAEDIFPQVKSRISSAVQW